MKIILLSSLGLVVVGLALWIAVPLAINKVREPAFQTIKNDRDNIFIRRYDPYIVAQVTVSGTRREAASEGFRQIANYIFGNNRSRQTTGSEKVAMTAPVIQQSTNGADKPNSQKIAMTAPVIQQSTTMQQPTSMNKNDQGQWDIQFVMPANYTMDTLPIPNNPAVKIISVNSKRWVGIKFSGAWNDRNINRHLQILRDYIRQNNIAIVGPLRTAFYNAPWTPPFMKRNEIMVELK